MDIKVICFSKNRRMNQVKLAIEALNYIQNYFYFCLDKTESDICETYVVNWKQFYQKHINNGYEIFITEKAFDDNWFSHEGNQLSVISTADWEQLFSPLSLKAYIVYQIAQAVINFNADIDENVGKCLIHERTKGCFFDFCANKLDIKIGMIAGVICPECRNALKKRGVEDRVLDAIEKMLDYVRLECNAKPMVFASNTAFVVMKFTENDENQNAYLYGIKSALKELGIKCIRADDNVMFRPISEQVIEYINSCRFIIVKADTSSLNVYLELGLAMGLRKDILVISESAGVVNLPIDIKDMECLTYTKGNYAELKDKVKGYYEKNYHYHSKN